MYRGRTEKFLILGIPSPDRGEENSSDKRSESKIRFDVKMKRWILSLLSPVRFKPQTHPAL